MDRYRRAKVAEADRRRAAIAAGKPLRDKDGRLLRPLGTGSINKTLSTLSAILEQAVEYSNVERNVAAGRRRRLPSVKPRRSYLDSAAHIAALLDAAGELDRERKGHTEPFRRALLATLTLGG